MNYANALTSNNLHTRVKNLPCELRNLIGTFLPSSYYLRLNMLIKEATYCFNQAWVNKYITRLTDGMWWFDFSNENIKFFILNLLFNKKYKYSIWNWANSSIELYACIGHYSTSYLVYHGKDLQSDKFMLEYEHKYRRRLSFMKYHRHHNIPVGSLIKVKKSVYRFNNKKIEVYNGGRTLGSYLIYETFRHIIFNNNNFYFEQLIRDPKLQYDPEYDKND